jgi:hypothetical protein
MYDLCAEIDHLTSIIVYSNKQKSYLDWLDRNRNNIFSQNTWRNIMFFIKIC